MKVIISKRKNEEGFWLILCPKEGKEVPDYVCAGSFYRGVRTCAHVQAASIGPEGAQTKCLWPEEREELDESM